MPEDERQQQQTQQETQSEPISADDVRQMVNDAVNTLQESDNAKYDALAGDIATLGSDVRVLMTKSEEQPSEEVVYVVRLDASQTDTVKSFGRVLCTEGLLLVILLAVVCGLMGFRQMTKGLD